MGRHMFLRIHRLGVVFALAVALTQGPCWSASDPTLSAQTLSGRTLTVSKSSSAYVTVQSALNAAGAGDTVLVQAGAYNERVVFPKSGNSSAGFITLRGSAGAILDGSGLSQSPLVEINGKSYVRVIGLEVRNVTGGDTPTGIGVYGGGSDIQILGNHVHGVVSAANAHGIAVYGNASVPISRLAVSDNEIEGCKLGQSESLVLNGNVTDFRVTGNRVHDNDNIGIDFIGFEGTGPANLDQARSGLCAGNRVYNISTMTNATYHGDRSADGIYVDGGKDIVIEGNTVDNADIGIEVASEHAGKTTSGITVRSNCVSRSYQSNLMVGGYAANRGSAAEIRVVNNTTYAGGQGEAEVQFNCLNVAFRNNIFVAGKGGGYLRSTGSNNSGITADNNLYFGGSASATGAWSDAHALFVDPLLANAPSDLHLRAGSPAIDHGLSLETAWIGTTDLDGQTRVQGLKPDLGADEWGSVAVTSIIGPEATRKAGKVFPDAVEKKAFHRRDALGRSTERSFQYGFPGRERP